MNQSAYREFCRDVPDLPVFVQDWYLDAVCKDGTWDAAVVSENGLTVGVLPYFLKRKYGFSYITCRFLSSTWGRFFCLKNAN